MCLGGGIVRRKSSNPTSMSDPFAKILSNRFVHSSVLLSYTYTLLTVLKSPNLLRLRILIGSWSYVSYVPSRSRLKDRTTRRPSAIDWLCFALHLSNDSESLTSAFGKNPWSCDVRRPRRKATWFCSAFSPCLNVYLQTHSIFSRCLLKVV
jgi:hypothetical protein